MRMFCPSMRTSKVVLKIKPLPPHSSETCGVPRASTTADLPELMPDSTVSQAAAELLPSSSTADAAQHAPVLTTHDWDALRPSSTQPDDSGLTAPPPSPASDTSMVNLLDLEDILGEDRNLSVDRDLFPQSPYHLEEPQQISTIVGNRPESQSSKYW